MNASPEPPTESIRALLCPESVALVGVSRRSGPGAYNGLEMIRRFGYSGRVHLVHPKATEILGVRPVASLRDLPEIPDLVVITVGRDRVLPVVQEAVAMGVPAVIVVSQGFADADAHGRALQRELAQAVNRSGTRLLGPNTMGVLNAHAGFSSAFLDVERSAPAPGVSLISQSGVFQVGPREFIAPLGKAIDVGNAADLDVADLVPYFAEDPETRVLAVHLEGISRGSLLMERLAAAASRKPVVVLKAGWSQAGAAAALSHTGSLVGEDALVDAALERAGVLRVHSIAELRAACRALEGFESAPGDRVGVITCTGAAGILAADAFAEAGLRLGTFPDALREALTPERMAWHRLGNPADIWPLAMSSGDYVDFFLRTAVGWLETDHVDALLAVLVCMDSPLHADHDLVRAAERLAASKPAGKPVALWLYGTGAARQREAIQARQLDGVVAFETLDDCVWGLGATVRRQRRIRERDALGPRTPGPPPADDRPLPVGEPLSGPELEALLARWSVPLAPCRAVRTPEAAAEAAVALGAPVVLKLLSPRWSHKSEHGAVVLGLRDPEAVLREAQALVSRFLREEGPEAEWTLLVQQQVAADVELLCGLRRDPQLGPAVVVGQGGIATEVARDVSYGLAPLRAGEAARMLDRLRLRPLLGAFRGRPPLAREAVERLLETLSDLSLAHPEIRELDLNPVLLGPQGCVVVDARAVATAVP